MLVGNHRPAALPEVTKACLPLYGKLRWLVHIEALGDPTSSAVDVCWVAYEHSSLCWQTCPLPKMLCIGTCRLHSAVHLPVTTCSSQVAQLVLRHQQ
jgi:hypothetical protein